MLTISVNGRKREVSSPDGTPLLYVLRDELGVESPQFGCGLAQCGACAVLMDGQEIRSCITPSSMAVGKEITTVEGLPARWAKQKNLSAEQAEKTLHPVQVPLCGFCQSGMMIKATELLEKKPNPTVDEIKTDFSDSGLSAHLCRCGSYVAIIEAVRFASTIMATGGTK